ncbi:MAG: ABC transporter permease, partial [Verrucomicrobiota bacterium]
MNPYGLAIKSLRYRTWTVGMTVLSIGLGVALLLGVERIRHDARSSFIWTLSGTDLVVGARSGPVSLLLYTVFGVGNPTRNISWETYEKIKADPRIAWTIPLSLGDSHKGFRVLGTEPVYFERYLFGDRKRPTFAAGDSFQSAYDAVLGAHVARRLGYELGDEIVLAHGHGEGFVDHADQPFTVSGILRPTGTPVDRTVHISLKGMAAIHADWGPGHDHDHDDHDPLAAALRKHQDSPEQITAFFVGTKTRASALSLQRTINTSKEEPLSGVLPGVALMELWSVVRVGEYALLIISLFVLAVALAGMFTALMTSLNERRREMAILRSVGAQARQIVGLIVIEAGAVTLAGLVAGVLIFHGLLVGFRPILSERFGLLMELQALRLHEWGLLLFVMLFGMLAGLIPGLKCSRQALNDG